MHATSAVAIAATLFASVGLAAPMTARSYTSAPFNLTVTSADGKYSSAAAAACHSGAAIEALCVYPGAGTEFTFNATDAPGPVAGSTNPGAVVFTLPSQPNPYPEPLGFYKNETSNVNAGFFGDTTSQPQFSFTYDNLMAVVTSATSEDYDNWFVCPQTFLGYMYETLSYVDPATGAPDNADCTPVTVRRVF